jgi:heterodisulfide reductase subunit B
MKSYALFLGCTVPVRGMHYEASARLISDRLGFHLVDVPEFGCCGFPLEGADHLTSYVMAAMSLAAAERNDLDIVTLCSACTATLTKANKKLKEDRALREEVNKVLAETGAEFKGKTNVSTSPGCSWRRSATTR